MINLALERLKQALHDLDDAFVPAGRVRADDVRVVIAETKRLNERMQVLERALVLEVSLRDARRAVHVGSISSARR